MDGAAIQEGDIFLFLSYATNNKANSEHSEISTHICNYNSEAELRINLWRKVVRELVKSINVI